MAGLNPTGTSFSNNCDIQCGRGQLGRTFNQSTPIVGGALWTLFPDRPNKYLINIAAPQVFTLPLIGTGPTQAQPGHNVWIKNVGTAVMTINNSTGSLMKTLQITESTILVASNAPVPNQWEEMANNMGDTSETLQNAYDDSVVAGDNPQIVITSVPVSIGNAVGNGSNDVFKVTNTTNTADFVRVHGLSATTCSTATGDLVTNSSVAGSNVVSDGNVALTTTTTNQMIMSHNNGTMLLGGLDNLGAPTTRIMPGISGTGPNYTMSNYKFSTTGAVATSFNILSGAAASVNRCVSMELNILAVTTTAGLTAVGESASYKVLANAYKILAGSSFIASSPIVTQFGALSYAGIGTLFTFTLSNSVITLNITQTAATTDVIQYITTLSLQDLMV